VLRRFFGGRRSPEADEKLIRQGGEVVMVCWIVPGSGRPRRFDLTLGETAHAVERLRDALGPPPYGVVSVSPTESAWIGGLAMSDVTGTSDAGARRWTVSVPSRDVRTLRGVLSRISVRAPRSD
jgi:hypothetical protein